MGFMVERVSVYTVQGLNGREFVGIHHLLSTASRQTDEKVSRNTGASVVQVKG